MLNLQFRLFLIFAGSTGPMKAPLNKAEACGNIPYCPSVASFDSDESDNRYIFFSQVIDLSFALNRKNITLWTLSITVPNDSFVKIIANFWGIMYVNQNFTKDNF